MSNNELSTPRAGRGRRLAAMVSVLATTLGAVLLSGATPAAAALSNVTVSVQTGSSTYGTTGNVTYSVTVSRTSNTPNSFTLSALGLPAGASMTSPSPFASFNFTTATRTVPVTIRSNGSVAAGSNAFSIRANGSGFDPTGAATLVVAKRNQTINFAPLASKQLGEPDFNVGATATSGLAVGFAASGSCTVTGVSVHLTVLGACTITATQGGDGNNNLAPPVSQTFQVTKRNQTITFLPISNKNNIDGDFTLTASASSGLAVTYSASIGPCTVTGAVVHLTGVGTCTINASQPGDGVFNAAPGVTQTFTVATVVPTHELFAVAGSTTLAGAAVPVWGYNYSNSAVTKPSGPTITVTQGTQVVLVLHNQLTEPTSLVIRGQHLTTDRTGAAPSGTKAYIFTPTEPGTFIYEAGPIANAQHQVAMGLYGTLVVKPSSGDPYGTANEAVVLVSEIDPALNGSANPAAFDMRNFAPKYTLLNGTVYSASADLATAAPGSTLLLRYVNAGINYHSMSILGANQQIVGDDGHALAQPYTVVAQTVGPGQTFDALVGVSGSAVAGTKLAVFDANLQLRNRNRRPAAASATVSYGGAMAFVTIGGAGGSADTTGPVASNPIVTATTISATISDANSGNSNVVSAEYFIDSAGAAGTGTSMSGAFGSPTASVNATFLSALVGNHTVYVRGQDSAGKWGPVVSVFFTNDNRGPATTGLSLTPNPTTGSDVVALHATGSDAATGGSLVTAAEYTIDGSNPTAMALNNPAAVTVSLDATISVATLSGLTEGTHAVAIRTRDAAGNWGSLTSISLTVDKTGPVTTAVAASPNPNNGALGVNSSTPAVRVTASTLDAASLVVRAEGFIDADPDTNPAHPAYGTGFLFVPVDGVWNSPNEVVSADIPLVNINALSTGNHTIYVHAKDAAGNWGLTSSVVLVIDRTAPTVVSITRAAASPVTGISVQFTVTFSEPVGAVPSSNFTLMRGSGMSGAAIISVTGTGATRTVTVATGGGSGTVGLNLTSAPGITDLAGNTLLTTGLPLIGPAYTVTSPQLYFSTSGNSNPPGVGGNADDADIYWWNSSAFSRVIDVTILGTSLPSGANVDGFDRVDANHFYMSFNGNVTISLPGPDLTVADEDVVFYNAGTWSLYFDGSARNVGSTDLDAISVVGGILYFSTDNTALPNGVSGSGDDADIYSWDSTTSTFARVVDASAVGWSTANVDGLVWVDSTHVYLSYSSDTTVPGVGVQNEDVVYNDDGTWMVYFDGTARGLTSNNLDVDAFDIS